MITARGVPDTVPLMGATKTHTNSATKIQPKLFWRDVCSVLGVFPGTIRGSGSFVRLLARVFVAPFVSFFFCWLKYSAEYLSFGPTIWLNRLFSLAKIWAESILFFWPNFWLNRFLALAEILAACLALVGVKVSGLGGWRWWGKGGGAESRVFVYMVIYYLYKDLLFSRRLSNK